jgi:hypothetical protein
MVFLFCVLSVVEFHGRLFSGYIHSCVFVCDFSIFSPSFRITKPAFVYLLLQSRITQPKDNDLSDCAKNGYAGIIIIIIFIFI